MMKMNTYLYLTMISSQELRLEAGRALVGCISRVVNFDGHVIISFYTMHRAS
jgi:hypothetical protein